MGGWYWIGVIVGAGVALGILAAGIVAALGRRGGPGGARPVRRSASLVFGWYEAIGGLLGGFAGAFGAAPIVAGALRRGGTAAGLAVLVGLAALLAAALAFVPFVGYLEAVALARGRAAAPLAGARAARRASHART